jgi:hypothetical protein
MGSPFLSHPLAYGVVQFSGSTIVCGNDGHAESFKIVVVNQE